MSAFAYPTTGPADREQNPLLEQIHEAVNSGDPAKIASLPPEAHEAIRRSGVIPAIVQKATQPSPQIVSQSGPGPIGGPPTMDRSPLSPQEMNAAPTPAVSSAPAPAPLSPLDTAQQHVRDVQAHGTGISHIHNPILRGLATAGDIVAGTFAPRAEQLIPGTMGHHALDLGQAENEVAQEQGNLNQPVERRLKTAQATEQESLPALHESQTDVKRLTQEEQALKDRQAAELGTAKNETEQGKIHGQQEEAKANHRAALAQHGYKEDEQGNIVPLEYGEMSESQQAVHDLKAAQSEQAEATAAYKKAQAANQPQVAALQQARIAGAQQTRNIALRRLGLSEATYEARYLGTDKEGAALPGTILTEEGKPVGTANAANVRPTAQERNKADLASSAHDQLQDLKSIVQKRPDIFGPAAGRKTDFQAWLGSQDPDAQRFIAARTIAGDHLAGVFGGRSEAALSALDKAIGQFKTNPEAVVSGLDQLDKANKVFLQKGTPRTTGSNAATQQPVVPPPANAPVAEEYVRDKTGKLVKKSAANH